MSILLAAALAAASAAASAPVVPPTGDCTGQRLCYAENLSSFFATLSESRRDAGRPIHIMQIGDSHTAGDMISNGWRTAFQARYGFGGRGVLAAGRPYNGVITFGVTQSMTPGWSVNANFGKGYRGDGAALGLSGYSLTTSLAGERLGVTTDTPDQNFDRVTVCALRQPGGGSLLIQVGAKIERLDLDASQTGAECRTVDNEWRVSSAQVTTEGNGPVTVTSFATFTQKGGVVLSNLGVSGSQLVHLNREDDRVVETELEAYRPDLIVFAFGTNEGFSQSLTPDQFEQSLRAQIRRIRKLAGRTVPILIVGAPDANTQTPAIAGNYGSPTACPNTGAGEGTWYTPTLLGAIRERQRRVAREMNTAFWDWSAAMGGMCAAVTWRNADPPLVRGDHVHFTRAGGTRIGSMIFNDIDAAFAATRRP